VPPLETMRRPRGQQPWSLMTCLNADDRGHGRTAANHVCRELLTTPRRHPTTTEPCSIRGVRVPGNPRVARAPPKQGAPTSKALPPRVAPTTALAAAEAWPRCRNRRSPADPPTAARSRILAEIGAAQPLGWRGATAGQKEAKRKEKRSRAAGKARGRLTGSWATKNGWWRRWGSKAGASSPSQGRCGGDEWAPMLGAADEDRFGYPEGAPQRPCRLPRWAKPRAPGALPSNQRRRRAR